MIEIKVMYFGMLRELAGKRQEVIRASESSTTQELLERLGKLHGQKFVDFIFDSKGKVRDGIAFAVNGDSVSVSKLARIHSKDVNEFAILPPISGGAHSGLV